MSANLSRLAGVHPDLVRIIQRAAERASFVVTEGLRTVARQRELVAQGKSRTMNSRHLTGHAVDLMVLVDGRGSWDWPVYEKLSAAVKQSARDLGIPVEWGGDWKSFRDGPHFQLPFAAYPVRPANDIKSEPVPPRAVAV